jgi:hypothetical protein
MVVILRDAALVFWMEYRRYVRTRRYWVLALAALAFCVLSCAITAALAAIPQVQLRLSSISVFVPATAMGLLAAIASTVHNPLSVRMLQDVYKTRWLSDLYLTELHPLGVVLGRAAATTALTGLILLMLTPAGLWLLQLIGAPLGAWVPIALLALVSYFFGSCLEAYTLRSLALGEEQFGSLQGVRFASMLVLGFSAGWVLSSFATFSPMWNLLAQLPVWALTPPTAPFLLFVGIQGGGWLHALLGALFAVGFALWVAVAAAQWRDWWSDGAYRLLRWGGTAFWLAFVSVHAAYFAQAFVRDAASAERMLFLALIIATLLNLSVAPLMGYFGVARRPQPLRFALPYPWSGLVWQWALHWLVAGALYLAVGLASGVWVAPTKWLFWTTYFWAAFVLLAQAVSAEWWAYYSIYPTPLQGDYAHGYLLNTRGMRATLDQLINVSKSGLLSPFLVLGLLLLAKALLSVAALRLSAPALAITIDWCLRLHPWYGVYQEWLGGNAWLYLPYSLAWALVLWVVGWRRGRQSGATAVRGLEWWRRHLERAPDETPKTVA